MMRNISRIRPTFTGFARNLEVQERATHPSPRNNVPSSQNTW
ncbi:hypothetical protein CPAR01_01628 [Colletotrichum paranaense]|uniref:Uncharacterized protein n=2 Tax=Colletotrichum acutatum species complex TaxID=2707335 RepID=A0AAI9YDE3_9PEZI|nr:uncharacterized protein CPAR01_01628 [Colletotrichum paranaense]KAK1498996.1 hypothetical protein CCUS01_02616 [Colletotrichum cuscutae]KAK1547661.1 hypothetical protein CPAR01_01628 [Colletotrichum paranaense]